MKNYLTRNPFTLNPFVLAAVLSLSSIGVANGQFSDRVLVVVNTDVITQSELDARKSQLLAELQQNEAALPADFTDKLLDSMISDRLQTQEAERRNLQPTDQEIDLGVQRFAERQNISLQQLQYNLAREGQTMGDFRRTLSDTISISRLKEYYTRARVEVPDYEIDGFLAVNGASMNDVQYQVAQLRLPDPELNRDLAEQIRTQIVETGNFEAAVQTYSQAANADNNGLMGWRRPEQLPDIFVDALEQTQEGGVTDVIETPNGLHILKLIALRGERVEVIQHKTKHILVTADTNVARSQAVKKLQRLKDRAENGESFSSLARVYSDDSVSAASGGGLGWVTPGDMVKQFEDVMLGAPIGAVSEPFNTQFGVHILMVEDRREKNVTKQMARVRADNILRRQRADREFSQWLRELREQAYVEFVSDPA